MYEVIANTRTQKEAFDVVCISKELALAYFNTAIAAVDAYDVVVMDACTGVIVFHWEHGTLTVMDEIILK